MDATPVQAAEPGLQADAGVPWHASLRTRLMLWVGLLLALLLLAAIATAFYAARSRIVADAEARTRFEAQQAADRLDATMRSVRISGESLIDLGNRVELGREQLLAAMEKAANPGTVGGLVALEPGVLADRGRLAYYVGIAARGVPDRDLLADGYDLVGREWYQRTLQATSPWWSEPYFSETAGGRYMTTLNLPLRNREAKRTAWSAWTCRCRRCRRRWNRCARWGSGPRCSHPPAPSPCIRRRASRSRTRCPATSSAPGAATSRRWRPRARRAVPCSSPTPMRAAGRPASRCCSRSATAAGACSSRSVATRCWRTWSRRPGCWA